MERGLTFCQAGVDGATSPGPVIPAEEEGIIEADESEEDGADYQDEVYRQAWAPLDPFEEDRDMIEEEGRGEEEVDEAVHEQNVQVVAILEAPSTRV